MFDKNTILSSPKKYPQEIHRVIHNLSTEFYPQAVGKCIDENLIIMLLLDNRILTIFSPQCKHQETKMTKKMKDLSEELRDVIENSWSINTKEAFKKKTANFIENGKAEHAVQLISYIFYSKK